MKLAHPRQPHGGHARWWVLAVTLALLLAVADTIGLVTPLGT